MKKLTGWINWAWVKDYVLNPFGAGILFVAILTILSIGVGLISYICTIAFGLGWGLLQ